MYIYMWYVNNVYKQYVYICICIVCIYIYIYIVCIYNV